MSRKAIYIVFVVVALALAAVPFAYAQQTRMHRHASPEAHMFFMGRLEHLKSALDLSDQQVDQIKAIAADFRDQNAQYRDSIHGGLAQGLAPALMEEIQYDEQGNIQGGSFMDYLLPTAMETPSWEVDRTVTPSPHHPLGAKGVAESPTVGAPPAIANAVVDALWHLGVRHIDIPITPFKVWTILREKGVRE